MKVSKFIHSYEGEPICVALKINLMPSLELRKIATFIGMSDVDDYFEKTIRGEIDSPSFIYARGAVSGGDWGSEFILSFNQSSLIRCVSIDFINSNRIELDEPESFVIVSCPDSKILHSDSIRFLLDYENYKLMTNTFLFMDNICNFDECGDLIFTGGFEYVTKDMKFIAANMFHKEWDDVADLKLLSKIWGLRLKLS